MADITLSSGATVVITAAPFADSKELFQAVLRELQISTDGTDSKSEVSVMLTRFLAAGFSSKEVEKCLWKCALRCTHNGVKIVPETFEPVERRPDYMECMLAVAKENLNPFLKSLFAEFKNALSLIQSIPQ